MTISHKQLSNLISNYFFKPESTLKLSFYRVIIFSFILFFLPQQVTNLGFKFYEVWHPISFFSFLDKSIWLNIVIPCFYIMKFSSLLSLIGWRYSFFSKVTFVTFLIHVGFNLNFGKVFHGYHLLAMTLLVLCHNCFAKNYTISSYKDGMFFIDSKTKWKDSWPLKILKIYIVLIYFSSGFSKIYHSGLEWVFSENLLAYTISIPGKTYIARFLIDNSAWSFSYLAFFVVFIIQLGAPFSLLSQKLGYLYFFLWFTFHVGITLMFGGHYSFLTYILCNMCFLNLKTKDFSICGMQCR